MDIFLETNAGNSSGRYSSKPQQAGGSKYKNLVSKFNAPSRVKRTPLRAVAKRKRLANGMFTVYLKKKPVEIRMAIVPEDYPNSTITKEQADIIRTCLLEELDNVGEEGPQLQFNEVRHVGNIMRAVCVDMQTCLWLADAVHNCTPWEGAKLKLVKEPLIYKSVKAVIWIPGPATEPKKILHRLKVQNQALPMSSWRIVNAKRNVKGQVVVISMDMSSCELLHKKFNCKLFLNFSTVLFKLFIC